LTPQKSNAKEIDIEAAGDTMPMILTAHCDSLEGALDRRVRRWGDTAPN
jgi:hypothetical protein